MAGVRLVAGVFLASALAASACRGDNDGTIRPANDAKGGATTSVAEAPGKDGAGGDRDAERPKPGGVLRLGVERLRSLDPAFASPVSQSELTATDLLFDGLTAMRRGDEAARPALAAEWTPSPDLKVWRFVLRADAAFHHGRPVSADDVKYTLERLAKRGTGSLAAVRLEVIVGTTEFVAGAAPEIKGLRVVDPRTLEIETTEPFGVLPELLASPAYGVVPKEIVEAADALDAGGAGVAAEVGGGFGQRPVGSGPFAFKGREGKRAQLVRAGEGTALLDGIDLVEYDDLASAYDDFVDRKLDWSLVAPSRADDAAQRFGDSFVPFHAQLFYGFNLTNPKFADVRFRRAITKAIDRSALVRAVYAGIADPLAGVVPAGVPGHVDDPCGDPCRHDPAAAKALVAEAFPDGGVPEVQIDYYADPSEEAVAGIIETSLEAAGIPAAKRPRPFDRYQDFAVSGKQELFRLGWIGVYPSPEAYLGPLLVTKGPDNVLGFSDPRFDGALKAARAAPDVGPRLDAYREAERIALELVPLIPITQFRTRAVVAARVRDLELDVTGTFAGDRVWLTR